MGSLYGYYWYHEQLLATPLVWWIFTPDSPLSTSFFTLTLTLLLLDTREGKRTKTCKRCGERRPEGLPISTSYLGRSYLSRKTQEILGVLACATLIKYGLWAVVVIGDYWIKRGPVQPVETLLFLSHLGMVAQGYLFLRHWPFYFGQGVLVGAWLILNDYVDYALGWHPYLFRPDQEPLAAAAALALSACWFLYCLGRKITANKEY
ncbi:DUF1405 domain-containing protein [Thermanaeromonas sp.]|uniref:DUF1405 domain-containing protein n=1 Tax=Thermanaeromonas sp. TaxID=2003697 RepID=UPI002638775D|nr:DUF1405 domain-containing protein [Thermanaeromonas sp.]